MTWLLSVIITLTFHCAFWDEGQMEKLQKLADIPSPDDYSNVCVASGDPHFNTFDGVKYEYQGRCNYTLVKNSNDNLPSFEIIGEFHRLQYHSDMSVMKSLQITCPPNEIELDSNFDVHIDGDEMTTIIEEFDWGRIERYKNTVVVRKNIGLTLYWGSPFRAMIIQEPGTSDLLFGNLCGLCGNNNNIEDDEFTTRDGQLVTDIFTFGDSWRTNPDCQFVDVNECEDGSHNCHPTLGSCTNTDGGFTCTCIQGTVGNGLSCIDVDECEEETHDCNHELGVCTNTVGGFTCSCVDGYDGDGYICAACPSGWNMYNNHCYYINTDLTIFEDARADCENKGTLLASIHSQEEDDYLRELLLKADPPSVHQDVWIGMTDLATEGYFQWLDGSKVDYTNWRTPDPQGGDYENCVLFYSKFDGGWIDYACKYDRGYICKTFTGVNQCLEGSHECHPMAKCINTEEGYECSCREGYIGDGRSCFPTCPTDPGWSFNDAYCYFHDLTLRDQPEAKSKCESLGTTLTSIHSAAENDYISSLIKDTGEAVWIGLEDIVEEGTFQWVDNTTFVYHNWKEGKPDNYGNADCLSVYEGFWRDWRCGSRWGPSTLCKKYVGCGPGWLPSADSCFLLSTSAMTYADATAECERNDAKLANFRDVSEQSYVTSLLSQLDSTSLNEWWIGLHDKNTEGSLEWVDGTAVDKDNLNVEELTNSDIKDCVSVNSNGTLQMRTCSDSLVGYMCKRQKHIDECLEGTHNCHHNATCTDTEEGFECICREGYTGDGQFCYASCPESWGYNGVYCYYLERDSYSRKSYTQAVTACENMGAKLASIHNKEEEDFILFRKELKNIGEPMWIGLTDTVVLGDYRWADNTELDYIRWPENLYGITFDNQDNQHCVIMKSSGLWDDTHCGNAYKYICQKPSDCSYGWIPYEGSCLYVNVSALTYSDAAAICEDMRSTLTSIRDDDERAYITSMLSSHGSAKWWIGLSDATIEGNLEWADGTTTTDLESLFPEDLDNSASKDCVTMDTRRRLEMHTCSDILMGYICKKNKDVNECFDGTDDCHPDATCTDTEQGYECKCREGFRGDGRFCFATCQSGWGAFDIFWYHLSKDWVVYDKAESDCNNMGGKIGSIHSFAETEFILGLRDPKMVWNNDAIWIGVYFQPDKSFVWSDNSMVDFVNWNPPYPYGTSCVQLHPQGTWHERPCGHSPHYICKKYIGCRPGWAPYGESCFYFETGELTYSDAEAACETINATLATIADNDEQSFITSQIQTARATDYEWWIGLNDRNTEGNLKWIDGTAVVYQNWLTEVRSNSDTNDCIMMDTDGKWVSRACGDSVMGYICKRRKENNECHTGRHTCNPVTGTCKDTNEGFECGCKDGYGGDNCQDIDECADGTHTCHPTWGVCKNTVGGHTCTCKEDHFGDGHDCSDYRDCSFVAYYLDTPESGIYNITPTANSGWRQVYCDMESDGGGWTVFQRRFDGSVNFYRDWEDYKNGFGSVEGEYWLGLEFMHELGVDRFRSVTRYDIEDFEGNKAFAFYYGESVRNDESDNYSSEGGTFYGGDAGNGFPNSHKPFSTRDRDNDNSQCAQLRMGGWWYTHGGCGASNLNGLYLGPGQDNSTGMAWYPWKNNWEVLKGSEIKTRHYQFKKHLESGDWVRSQPNA